MSVTRETADTESNSDSRSLAPLHHRRLLPVPLPPPPAPLEEDAYLAGISAIIERDFFPSLHRLRLQSDFLDAVQSVDLPRASALGFQLAQLSATAGGNVAPSSLATPSASSVRAASATPTPSLAAAMSTPGRPSTSTYTSTARQPADPADPATPATPATPLDASLSLDAFQSRYTSEDNASFQAILKRQNDARRDRYNWAYDPGSKKMTLLLANGDGNGNGNGNGNGSDSGASKGTDSSTAAVSDDPRKLYLRQLLLDPPDDTVTPINSWKFQAKNSLMYQPDGAPLTYADIQPGRSAPRAITHAATRFERPEGTATTQQLTATTASTAGELSASSAQRHTQQVWAAMAKATPALFHGRPGLDDSPRVAGFGFVAATPSPAPHVDIDPSQLLTWGSIEGTPMLVDSGMDHRGSGSGGATFKLPPTPRREEVAMRLSERAAKSLRRRSEIAAGGAAARRDGGSGGWTPLGARAGKAAVVAGAGAGRAAGGGMSPAPGRPMTPSRQAMLSPAAQKLLAQSTRGGSIGVGVGRSLAQSAASRTGSVDAQLRASYSGSSPSPARGTLSWSTSRTPQQSFVTTPAGAGAGAGTGTGTGARRASVASVSASESASGSLPGSRDGRGARTKPSTDGLLRL
ncbi:nuclear protein Es2-domain-containing protein [Entophlyctis helioformis]|nr:nuclear protein Es2-domain-containing protein [Entophlyctis helioformis]